MNKVIIESPSVNSLFKCPLCNELIHSATVINECLHRFCKLCITNYFEKNNNKTCPVCQIMITNPLQTLKSDLTYQRLLYKISQSNHHSLLDEITCTSSIQIDTKINVYLDYWDMSLNLFPIESSIRLSNCYLECLANTPLLSIEKFLRIKFSLISTLKIEFFYKSFLLNTNNERLIDICYCFDINNKNSPLDIRFIVSPYGYKAILKRIRHSKKPDPLQIEVTPPVNSYSSLSSSTSSIDSTLKVKICRSQSSTNDWFIPQSTPSIQLPDLINSCEKQTKYKKKSKLPPRRRIRFIPTMVKVPPSIFDCLSELHTFQSNEQKTICKVPPYISEYDSVPLDLSLK